MVLKTLERKGSLHGYGRRHDLHKKKIENGLGQSYQVSAAIPPLAESTVTRAHQVIEHVDRTLVFPACGTLQLHNF